MQIVVLADELQKQELAHGLSHDGVVWINDEEEFIRYPDADAYIDLEFVNDADRIALLKKLLPRLVIINSVTDTLQETTSSLVRINGWTTFLSSPLLEAACLDDMIKAKTEEVFSLFNKRIEWLQDEPGFITARVVSMIINEAFISLGEGVSTQEEINTAMKLGTAYPYGPFEWAEKIGLQNIVTLLQKLAKEQVRYMPAELLVQATDRSI